MRVVVGGPLHPSGRAVLDAAEIDVTYLRETSVESLQTVIGDADAVLLRTQPLSAETIAMAPKLKIASRHGVGYDAVDVAALNARGIALAICGDVNATTVAEHVAMLMLATCKRLMRADAAVRVGPWEWRNGLESRDLRGQRLLLVGYGRIGQHVGRLMQAFGMALRAHDPFLQKNGWPENSVPMVNSLAEGLGWADVISFSLPHSGAPLIGAAEIAAMRDGVVLINTARGSVIDEEALINGLESGKIGAAGLDVFQDEPVPGNHPLSQFDQVVLTPHIAGLSRDSAERMAVSSAENILNFLNGSIDPALVVNRDHVTWPEMGES